MRMLIPPKRLRKRVSDQLDAFFETHDERLFKSAMRLLCEFYKTKQPKIEWFERIDHGRTLGKTFEDGIVYLMHPEDFARNRKYNTAAQYRNAVLHEFAHVLMWTDAETKANEYAKRFEKDLGKVVWKD